MTEISSNNATGAENASSAPGGESSAANAARQQSVADKQRITAERRGNTGSYTVKDDGIYSDKYGSVSKTDTTSKKILDTSGSGSGGSGAYIIREDGIYSTKYGTVSKLDTTPQKIIHTGTGSGNTSLQNVTADTKAAEEAAAKKAAEEAAAKEAALKQQRINATIQTAKPTGQSIAPGTTTLPDTTSARPNVITGPGQTITPEEFANALAGQDVGNMIDSQIAGISRKDLQEQLQKKYDKMLTSDVISEINAKTTSRDEYKKAEELLYQQQHPFTGVPESPGVLFGNNQNEITPEEATTIIAKQTSQTITTTPEYYQAKEVAAENLNPVSKAGLETLESFQTVGTVLFTKPTGKIILDQEYLYTGVERPETEIDLAEPLNPVDNIVTAVEHSQAWNDVTGPSGNPIGYSYEEQAGAALDVALTLGAFVGVGAGIAAKGGNIALHIAKPSIKTVGVAAGAGTVMAATAPSGIEQASQIPIVGQMYEAGENARMGNGLGRVATGAVGGILKTPAMVAGSVIGAVNLATNPASAPQKAASNIGQTVTAIGTDFITDPFGATGEFIGTAAAFKAAGKPVGKLGSAVKTKTAVVGQAEIRGELARQAGVDSTAAKTGYKSALALTEDLAKVKTPDTAPKTNIGQLTMFEGIDVSKVEAVLAEHKVNLYGTGSTKVGTPRPETASRYSADLDLEVAPEKFESLAAKLLEVIPENRGAKLEPGEGVRGIVARTPDGRVADAHMFDIHAMRESPLYKSKEIGTPDIMQTELLPIQRLPQKKTDYITIERETGTIYAEKPRFALSRKTQATYLPEGDTPAPNVNPSQFLTQKGIEYETKIDINSYKEGMQADAEGMQARALEPDTMKYKAVRVAGTIGNIGAKADNLLQGKGFKGVSDLTKKVGGAPERKSGHRAKDAVDLLGSVYEFENIHIPQSGQPVRSKLAQRSIDKNVPKIVEDPIFKAQARRGAQDRFDELTPGFKNWLVDKGILGEEARTTAGKEFTQTAYKSGETIPLDTIRSPDLKSGRTNKTGYKPVQYQSSPNPETYKVPNGYKQPAGYKVPNGYRQPAGYKVPSGYKPGEGYEPKQPGYRPKPGHTAPYTPKYGYGTPYGTGTAYEIGTSPKASGGKPEITVKTITFTRTEFTKIKKKDDKYAEQYYRTIRPEKIEHLSIIDPAEAFGIGTMTGSRRRPERIISTGKDRLLYEWAGNISYKPQPKGRSRKK